MIYHFTDSAHLPHILLSGELRPGRATVGGFPDPDFLWATASSVGDNTITGYNMYKSGQVSLVRFALDQSRFFSWREAQLHNPAWEDRHIRALETRANGANPDHWFCSMESYPLSDILAVDIRTYRGAWAPAKTRGLRGDGNGFVEVVVNGREFCSRKVKLSTGQLFYQIVQR